MAVATDLNPGSSPVHDLFTSATLACVLQRYVLLHTHKHRHTFTNQCLCTSMYMNDIKLPIQYDYC